jgi:hypothetical protein
MVFSTPLLPRPSCRAYIPYCGKIVLVWGQRFHCYGIAQRTLIVTVVVGQPIGAWPLNIGCDRLSRNVVWQNTSEGRRSHLHSGESVKSPWFVSALLTNGLHGASLSEDDGFSANRGGIPSILWKPKVSLPRLRDTVTCSSSDLYSVDARRTCFNVYFNDFLLCIGLTSDVLPPGFSHQNPVHISLLPRICYTLRTSYSPSFDQGNNIL